MASYEKRGKKTRVVVSVMDKGVRRKGSKTFDRKSDAKDWAMRIEIDKNDNRSILASQMTFVDYYEQWYTRYKLSDVRGSTAIAYKSSRNVVEKIFGDTRLSELTYILIQDKLDEYSKTHNRSTINVIMQKIKSSLRDALLDVYITKDIYSRLKTRGDTTKKDNVLSATEFEKLQSYLYAHWKDNQTNLAVLVALETGMRIGEVMMVSKNEVFPEFNMVYVKKSFSPSDPDDERTKNVQSVRKVKIPSSLSNILSEALKNKSGLLFTHTIGTIKNGQKALIKKLGLKPITFHGLRHSHTSYLAL